MSCGHRLEKLEHQRSKFGGVGITATAKNVFEMKGFRVLHDVINRKEDTLMVFHGNQKGNFLFLRGDLTN